MTGVGGGECAFCGEDRVTERHHIVPRRFGGSDDEENLLTLCPTCHEIVERCYDRSFYQAVGAYPTTISDYARGVEDAMQIYWDERINPSWESREWYNAAAWRAVDELMPGEYHFCDGCKLPATNETCRRCGTVRQ